MMLKTAISQEHHHPKTSALDCPGIVQIGLMIAIGCIGIPNALFATAALQGDASRMFPPHSLVKFLLVY